MLWVLGTTRVVGFEEDIGDTCFRGTRCPGGGTGWARNYIISKQKKNGSKTCHLQFTIVGNNKL